MINILENLTIPPNCSLVTIDVKSLYLNIPHEDGIQAVTNRLYYNNPKSDEIPIPTGTMKDLLYLVGLGLGLGLGLGPSPSPSPSPIKKCRDFGTTDYPPIQSCRILS